MDKLNEDGVVCVGGGSDKTTIRAFEDMRSLPLSQACLLHAPMCLQHSHVLHCKCNAHTHTHLQAWTSWCLRCLNRFCWMRRASVG